MSKLEQAHECLFASEKNVEISPKASVNRTYYCVFHAIRAVLALDKFESKTHKGIINEFRRRYIVDKRSLRYKKRQRLWRFFSSRYVRSAATTSICRSVPRSCGKLSIPNFGR